MKLMKRLECNNYDLRFVYIHEHILMRGNLTFQGSKFLGKIWNNLNKYFQRLTTKLTYTRLKCQICSFLIKDMDILFKKKIKFFTCNQDASYNTHKLNLKEKIVFLLY